MGLFETPPTFFWRFQVFSVVTHFFTMVSRTGTPISARVLLVCLGFSCSSLSNAFVVPHTQHNYERVVQTRRTSSSSTLLLTNSYGRNAEIWPPTNNDFQVSLQDSFPNGEIPESAIVALQQIDGNEVETKPLKWRKRLPRTIARILRRAASAQEEEAFAETSGGMHKTPAAVALALLLTGYVKPLDVLLVTFLSGYFLILGMIARSPRADGVTPMLPSLPPQGHVPVSVSNPLGYALTYSTTYDRFLKLGVLVGVLAPVLACLRYTLDHQTAAASAVARPIFLLCAQALSESTSRRNLTPLPLLILIPVAYNVARLGYLWNWCSFAATTTAVVPLTTAGRALAVANLVYASVHLFGFLLPVAVLKYMRAHFYSVEAEQVTTRAGMEESVGLSSLS